ncbi:MAG TPA: CDP-alcohol phosphatidyltransferase family protein [Thermoanaerobaculia bacterium]
MAIYRSLNSSRRPLKTRERRWPRALARRLAAADVRPNPVSAASVVFAAAAGTFLALSLGETGNARWPYLLAAAACVQLRLLCNLIDGLLAVESGLGSPAGEIWNDLPDRIADPLILVGAGLAVRNLPGGLTLGWLAGLLALLTAYVRVLGGSVGLPQSFAGPMAKPHRMFAITVGSLGSAVEAALHRPPWILYLALAVVVAGSAVTAVRRTVAVVRQLKSR